MSEWYGSPLNLDRGVELHREGSPVEETYDMSDPLDCSIFCSLQRYLSYQERETGGGVVEDSRGQLALKAPALLEARLLALRAWSGGGLELERYTRYWMAHAVLEAFFTPIRGAPGGGAPGGRAFVVPREFWAAEEADLPDDAVPRRAGSTSPGRTGPLDHVPYPKLYLPLARLLRQAVGATAGAGDAACLLDFTEDELARRVRDRSLGGVWVGDELLIFEPEIQRALHEGRAGDNSEDCSEGYSIGA